MFAVVQTGGKQYRVEPGTIVEVEKITAECGAPITFSEVLLVGEGESVSVGTPFVKGATVQGTVVEQFRGPKVLSFKKLKRQGKQWKRGHRQYLTRVRIEKIAAN